MTSIFPADEQSHPSAGAASRWHSPLFGVLCLLLAVCALEYTALWLPNMLNIANTLNHQIHDFPSRDRVIQEADTVVLLSLAPFVVTFAGAILLGRASLGDRAALPGARIGLEKLTICLFIVWTACLLIRVLFYAPSGFRATFLSILGLAGYEVAAATMIIGGISLRRASGSRRRRTWQYLARGAFIATCLFLVATLAVFAILIGFVATFHLFD